MKDFKKLPKMQCGGKVKKYQNGGGIIVEHEPQVGDKIGMAAGDKAAKEYSSKRSNWPLSPKKAAYAYLDAAVEAQDEARREANRGISPENRKKRGGKITKRK